MSAPNAVTVRRRRLGRTVVSLATGIWLAVAAACGGQQEGACFAQGEACSGVFCSQSAYCDQSGQCQSKRQDGEACTDPKQCTGGLCSANQCSGGRLVCHD